MPVETPQTTSLFKGWMLRISLLLVAFMGILGVFENTSHRLYVTSWGIPGEITMANPRQGLPTSWLDTENGPRADLTVRIKSDSQPPQTTNLFLSRTTIEALMRGETKRLTYEKGNPRRHRLDSEPPPPYGFGWLFLGLVGLAAFIFSLRLR